MLTKWVEGVARPTYRPRTNRVYEKPSQDRVLACVHMGLVTAQEIGRELGVKTQTARNYLHLLRNKGFVAGTEVLGKPTIWRLK